MPKGMVITVGVGRGIESGIVYSIKQINPDFIIFIVTKKSKETLERIEGKAKEVELTLPAYELVEVDDESKVDKTYEATVEAIRKMANKGIMPKDITIDYTTGSKPMSAGALYAAIIEGCANVVYITGERDKDGRVILGTESVLSTRPTRLLASRFLTEAVRLFNAWQFSAAKQIIEEFLRPFSKDEIPNLFPKHLSFLKLCDAYQAWDAFDHIAAQKAFEDINKTVMTQWSTAEEQIAINKGWVNKLAKIFQSQELKERLCEELLIDLWANALRRLEEKRFVDAVARLYRLCELIAQFRLWHKYNIDTGDVDLSRVPESMKKILDLHRNEKGKVQIALLRSYQLLAAFNDEIGLAWENTELKNAISARNNSIAAHGLEPVDSEMAQKLKEAIEPLLKKIVLNLEKKIQPAQFPKLQP